MTPYLLKPTYVYVLKTFLNLWEFQYEFFFMIIKMGIWLLNFRVYTYVLSTLCTLTWLDRVASIGLGANGAFGTPWHMLPPQAPPPSPHHPSPRLVSCSFVNVIDFMPELLTKVVVPLSLPVWGLSRGDSLA